MKRKLTAAIVLIMIIASVIFVIHSRNNDFYASVGIACTGLEYEEKDSAAYLKVKFDDEANTIKSLTVKDEKLKNKLHGSNAEDIIGVQIIIRIPGKILKEKHIDAQTANAFNLLLYSFGYDEYFEVADVSYK